MNDTPILNTRETAVRLGISIREVRAFVWANLIPEASISGGDFLFREADVIAAQKNLPAILEAVEARRREIFGPPANGYHDTNAEHCPLCARYAERDRRMNVLIEDRIRLMAGGDWGGE